MRIAGARAEHGCACKRKGKNGFTHRSFSRCVELPEHAPRAAEPPHGGACYKRRNDDCGSSFRNRDKSALHGSFR
jgi:hypothetical protein